MKLVDLSAVFGKTLYVNPDYIVAVEISRRLGDSYNTTTMTVRAGGRGAMSPATTYEVPGNRVADIVYEVRNTP